MTLATAVCSADGTRLAVHRAGTEGPALVAVHGFPDNHTVWDGVVAELAGAFRVATYDVRGTGASDKPRQRAAYRQERLTDDLAAVVEAVCPDSEPVHLLGHDWGSVQVWPALTDPRLAGRVASFTSISGPSLDHAAAWLRRGHRHSRAAARQLAHSWYTLAFQLPVLPEAVFGSDAGVRGLARAGVPHPRRGAPEVRNGIQLYRANMVGRLARPTPRQIDVPVQVLAPRDDRSSRSNCRPRRRGPS